MVGGGDERVGLMTVACGLLGVFGFVRGGPKRARWFVSRGTTKITDQRPASLSW